MKTNVIFHVPLENRNETIVLPAQCTYCGKDIDIQSDYYEWTYKSIYPLKHWVTGTKFGTPMLVDQKINGVTQKGSVTISAPYCDQHREGVKLFGTIITVGSFGMLAIAAIASWRIFGTMDALWKEIFVYLFLLFLGSMSGLLLSVGINTLLARIKPEFRDFPKGGIGHWGFSTMGVHTRGKNPDNSASNFLTLEFLNVESAKRFYTAYPRAEIVKGKEHFAE